MIDAAQLVSRANEKREKEMKDQLIPFYRYAGFNDDGITYVPSVSNEDVNTRLRGQYCPYTKGLGFHSPTPIEGVACSPVKASDVMIYDTVNNRYKIDIAKGRDALCKIYREHLTPLQVGAGFKGEEGESITAEVTYTGFSVVPSKSDFGDLTILNFVDSDNFRYSWLQRNYSDQTVKAFANKFGTDGKFIITGKVKRHNTIHGIKYTSIARCEVLGKNGMTLTHFADLLRETERAEAACSAC